MQASAEAWGGPLGRGQIHRFERTGLPPDNAIGYISGTSSIPVPGAQDHEAYRLRVGVGGGLQLPRRPLKKRSC